MSDESIHVAMFPSAGMGHLTPFLRLASLFLNNNCKLTLIIPLPTVTHAESQLLSNFHSSFPQLNIIPFHLPPPPSPPISGDPMFLRVKTLRESTHLLPPLISSLSSPLTFFISDIFLVTPLLSITQKLSLPNYTLFTSSASMFSFVSNFPTLAHSKFDLSDEIHIPGISFSPLPYSSMPPILFQPTLFRDFIMEDSPNLTKLDGFFLNTFEALESHSLKAFSDGKVVKGMPPIYAVGPFVPFEFEEKSQKEVEVEAEAESPLINWLNDQLIGSVVYVCFGSRTALRRDQMREIGFGLMRSGYNFLWVVKDKIVDKEDEEIGLDEVLGVELVEKMKEKGLVIKEWVDQTKILSHKSVGGFVSHCGWNSIMEAALNGVPILGWPQHSDQKINAGLVEFSGWGIWNKSWGWSGERLVKGEEIGDAIKVIIENQLLKVKAMQIKEGGRKAISVGGDCEVTIQKLIQKQYLRCSIFCHCGMCTLYMCTLVQHDCKS